MSFRNICILLLLPTLHNAFAEAERAGDALVLPVHLVSQADVSIVLDPAAVAWSLTKATSLDLNLTPPLYAGDTLDDGSRPNVSLRFLRLPDGTVVVRAQWSDATTNLVGSGVAFPDGGGAFIYKKDSAEVDSFPDAFCTMVPVKRGPHAVYPSMMMGEAKQPVELCFWQAGLGFRMLSAHGRASTAATKIPLAGKGAREDGQWIVTMALPNLVPGTPVCFAIWDGAKKQRDGRKYFTLWCEVE